MASFASRLVEYISYMGLEKQRVGQILGVSPQTISGYVKGTAAPNLEKLPRYCESLGVSADWLLGLPTTSRWSPDIQAMRLWLRAKAPELQAPDALTCMNQVMDLMAERIELCGQSWFVAGLLGLPVPAYEELRAGKLVDIDLALPRLAEFTGIPEMWFTMGSPEYLEPATDLSDYHNVLVEFARRDITPEDLVKAASMIEALVKRQRAIHPQPNQ